MSTTPKVVTIKTRTGETFDTTTASINYYPWGIDAITIVGSLNTKVRIPWTNIDVIYEETS